MTVLELVVLITLHVLTIKYRFSQSVKASSPKLSLLNFIGCYLIIFTLFLYMFRSYLLFDDYTTVFLCNLTWAWLLPISFTLAFGTVAVRTWRLHRIFTHYLNPGRFIADHYLMAFVFILLGVDVLLGIYFVDGHRPTATGREKCYRSSRHYKFYGSDMQEQFVLVLWVGIWIQGSVDRCCSGTGISDKKHSEPVIQN